MNLTKSLLSHTMLAAGLALSSVGALAQWDSDIIEAHVGRTVYGGERLPLREILDLEGRYRGRRIEYVILRAQSRYSYGTRATLLVNGYSASYSQSLDSYLRSYNFYLDSSRDEIGHEIRTLQLQVDGEAYVDSVAVKLSNDGGGWDPYPPRPNPPTPYPPVPAPGPQCRSDYDCRSGDTCSFGRCVPRGGGGWDPTPTPPPNRCLPSRALCGKNGNHRCCSGRCIARSGDNNNYCQ